MLWRLAFSMAFCAAAMATNPKGLAFLSDKAGDADVTTTGSGLMYKVLSSGPADAPSPESTTPCVVHYKGTLIDGTEFDSSFKRGTPTTFAPNQVVKGWTEALQLMKQGDHWELYLPSELAYGERGAGAQIKAGDALVFQLQLLEVKLGQSASNPVMALLQTSLFSSFQVWHLLALVGYTLLRSGVLGKLFSAGSGGGTKAAASHILVKDQELCEKLKADIAGGTPFEAAAKEHSTCPSGKSGGSLGTFAPGSMVPAFDQVVFDPATVVGQVYGPLQTQFGFHLIKVTAREEPPPVAADAKKTK
jgi:FKBP-type peptidyl-prolyl cis-trans isomerase FklB